MIQLFKTLLWQCWRFISQVRFTLILLAISMATVIIGTFYESQTRSHHEALTLYRHPLFMLLLGGYFLNILTSALRRWPFQKHHIGFLLTHLGLLMILLGQMLKIEKGVQGHLLLQEGTVKNSYIDSEKILLEVFKGNDTSKSCFQWVITPEWGKVKEGLLSAAIDQSTFTAHLKSYHHAQRELYQFWSKDGKLNLDKEISDSSLTLLDHYVFYGSQDKKGLETLFQNSLSFSYKGHPLEKGAKSALVNIDFKKNETDLLPYAIEFQILSPEKNFSEKDPEVWLYVLEREIPHPQNISTPWRCLSDPLKSLVDITVKAKPFLALYQTTNENHSLGGIENLFYIDEKGCWQQQSYSAEASTKLLILDKGYGAIAHFKAEFESLNWQSQVQNHPHYTPEYMALDPQEISALYSEWSKQGGVALLDEKSSFKSATTNLWSHFSVEQKTSLWLLHHLTEGVNWADEKGLWIHLKNRFWPLADELKNPDSASSAPHSKLQPTLHPNIERLSKLIWQIKSLAPLVQAQVMPMLMEENFFFESHPLYTQTLYLTLEGLHPIFLLLEENKPQKNLTLVSHVQRSYTPSISHDPDKELSTLDLELKLDNSFENLTIAIEKLDKGLLWPIFDGQFWIKASHPSYPLGYNLRLYQTYAEFYPGSLTAKNYHAKVSAQKDSSTEYVDVSMNKVMELASGYRFYLSSITPLQPTAARTALFTVSYDPFKNILTYPGALLVTLGSLILLIRKRAYVQQLFR